MGYASADRRYAFGDDFDAACCNTFETHIRSTTPIGVFPGGETPEGLVDMTGNTWDWTSSHYMDYPYNAADGREDPLTPGARRVVRGGSWCVAQVVARACLPHGDDPATATASWACGWRGRPLVLAEALGSDGLTKSAYQTSCTFFRLWR